jgi:hypothetical protein
MPSSTENLGYLPKLLKSLSERASQLNMEALGIYVTANEAREETLVLGHAPPGFSELMAVEARLDRLALFGKLSETAAAVADNSGSPEILFALGEVIDMYNEAFCKTANVRYRLAEVEAPSAPQSERNTAS